MAEDHKRSREEKLAVGALLLVQRRALKHIVAATAPVIATMHVSGGASRLAHMLALLATGRHLATVAAASLVLSRQAARASANRRLEAELAALGVKTSAENRAVLAAGAATRRALDEASAAILGDSLAAQWRSLAIASMGADERSVDASQTAARKLKPRLKRATDSEVARTYSEEHRASAIDLSKRGVIESDDLVRQWVAMLDACGLCWPHDGEQIPLDASFSGGEPGTLHPHCLCSEVIVKA